MGQRERERESAKENWLIGSMKPGEIQLETVLASSCLCSGQSLGSSSAGSDGPRTAMAMMAAAGKAQVKVQVRQFIRYLAGERLLP
jgi:hypothetical protein